ncbi:hypothetical protein QUF75_08855 [Desulfococcaceae bacterium HSG7]|nr:hypothetical protein [Desulfococcaceae bacterium HSG9]MDM8554824.1 hypothetical protein [Desulfococcaceae bacterium HSG7]
MKKRIIAITIISVMVSLGVADDRLAAQDNQSFKELLEQRIKEKQQKQKQADKKEAIQKAQKEAKAQQQQKDTCGLIKEALFNYFEVWKSVASELSADLDFDMGDPPNDIQKNVGMHEFIDHKYEKCSFYFLDQILWDRNTSRKAYFKYKLGNNSKPYYITIYSTYYNPKITLPEVKSQWVQLYNRRHISQKTIVSLLDSKRLVKFKKDVKVFLLKNIQ